MTTDVTTSISMLAHHMGPSKPKLGLGNVTTIRTGGVCIIIRYYDSRYQRRPPGYICARKALLCSNRLTYHSLVYDAHCSFPFMRMPALPATLTHPKLS